VAGLKNRNTDPVTRITLVSHVRDLLEDVVTKVQKKPNLLTLGKRNQLSSFVYSSFRKTYAFCTKNGTYPECRNS
jgi:hypothetical protein